MENLVSYKSPESQYPQWVNYKNIIPPVEIDDGNILIVSFGYVWREKMRETEGGKEGKGETHRVAGGRERGRERIL